jgi:hypothetical protein
VKFTVTARTTRIDVLLFQVDDPHKNSYFIDGLLLPTGIIAIANAGFVAESIGNLSDSYDFPFSNLPTMMKLQCQIADLATLDFIKSLFLSIKVRKLERIFRIDEFL